MRWISARTSREIARPVDEVWDRLVDVGRLAEWMGGVSEPRVTSGGELREGSTFASKYTYRDETVDVDYRVTRFEPRQAFGFESVDNPFPYRALFTLEPTETGTMVTKETWASGESRRTVIMFIFMRPIIRSMMRREIGFELARLGDVVEGIRD